VSAILIFKFEKFAYFVFNFFGVSAYFENFLVIFPYFYFNGFKYWVVVSVHSLGFLSTNVNIKPNMDVIVNKNAIV
jgi:hypothetical protein